MAQTKDFAFYKSLAQQLEQSSGKRLEIMEYMEKMYNVDAPDGMPKGDDVKTFIDPSPSNAIDTGVRMVSGTDPTFSIPFSDASQMEDLDTVKELANRICAGSSMTSGKPLSQGLAESALLYGEIHLRHRLVGDIINATSGEAAKKRLQRTQMLTPVLWDVLNPKLCRVATDDAGVTAHLLTRKMMVSEAMGIGDEAVKQLEGKKLQEEITVKEIYDLDNHCVWMEGGGAPFLLVPLVDGMIPIRYVDVEGSKFFDNLTVDRTRPFLYKLYKSKTWEQQCRMTTSMLTNLFRVAVSPQLWANVNDPASRTLEVDFSEPAGVLLMEMGEQIQQLKLTAFTPEIQQALQMLDQQAVQSTIYRTVSGESAGPGAAYSLVALLRSAGQQALIPTQRMCAHVLGAAMTDALLSLKKVNGGKKLKMLGADKQASEFDLSKIPDDLLMLADLEISLPMDQRENVQMALQVTGGERPLASFDWARENMLDIDNSSKMEEEILAEKFAYFQANLVMQQKQAEAMQRLQGQMQPQQGAPGQLPPGPQQGPPGQPPMPDLQNAQQGLPMAAPQEPGQAMPGLPPEQMQGGPI
jgi:hypothetical protein